MRGQGASGEEAEFTDVTGFHLTDNSNQKKMVLKVHSHGCGRVFIAISDIKKGGYVACFKLPQQEWVNSIFRKSQV